MKLFYTCFPFVLNRCSQWCRKSLVDHQARLSTLMKLLLSVLLFREVSCLVMSRMCCCWMWHHYHSVLRHLVECSQNWLHATQPFPPRKARYSNEKLVRIIGYFTVGERVRFLFTSFVNRYKELVEKLVQLLRSQFVRLSHPAFQNKKSCLVFFLVFSFSCPSVNSSNDESRLWKLLVWFEAIFLKKSVPKLLEMCYLSVNRSGEWVSDTVFFSSENNDTANQTINTSFFTSEKNGMTNQLAFLARRGYFYLNAFWRVNLGMYIIIDFISLIHWRRWQYPLQLTPFLINGHWTTVYMNATFLKHMPSISSYCS